MLRRGFTLIELLVVIAIIGVLLGILLPALEKANERARIAACGGNLHAIAIALMAYGNDYYGEIPTGPATPSTLDPTRTWETIGSHQLWIASAARLTGLGMLTAGGWITNPKVLVCTSELDGNLRADIHGQLAGPNDGYGSYAYRQMDQRSGRRLLTPAGNTLGNPAIAMAFDWQAEGPAPWAHNSHDGGEYLNILYADGHIQFFPNNGLVFGANTTDFNAMPGSLLHRLSQDWINADWAAGQPVSTAPQLP